MSEKRRPLNHNILTKEVAEAPTSELYVHSGSKGKNYRFVEVIEAVNTIGGPIEAGELLCIKLTAGTEVTTPEGDKITVVNEGEVLFIN